MSICASMQSAMLASAGDNTNAGLGKLRTLDILRWEASGNPETGGVICGAEGFTDITLSCTMPTIP